MPNLRSMGAAGVNRYDLAAHTRILAERDKRSQRIEALQREHNRCAWCGEAPVDPGQPFCLTHAGHDMKDLS